jgi:predicted nucleotidyltransferase
MSHRERGDVTADERLGAVISRQPYPLIFATISGAHLYGFPSLDSDFDLRGCHILPAAKAVGLDPGRETIESSSDEAGAEVDLVTHDVRKFFGLLLRKNGYVLEQLYSPLVVHATPEHEELKSIARGCITRHHNHHYRGFAETQWRLFAKEAPPRVKPLLYVYRVLLTGIRLMRAGEVEANLLRLNEEARLTQVDDLVARKLAGPEMGVLGEGDIAFHRREYERLQAELEEVHRSSRLPDAPTARPALNDLLVKLRLGVRTAGR